MVTKVLDDTAHGSGGNPEPLGNNDLWVRGGLGEDVFLGNTWNMVPVPHQL